MGMALSEDGRFCVANYFPAGNVAAAQESESSWLRSWGNSKRTCCRAARPTCRRLALRNSEPNRVRRSPSPSQSPSPSPHLGGLLPEELLPRLDRKGAPHGMPSMFPLPQPMPKELEWGAAQTATGKAGRGFKMSIPAWCKQAFTDDMKKLLDGCPFPFKAHSVCYSLCVLSAITAIMFKDDSTRFNIFNIFSRDFNIFQECYTTPYPTDHIQAAESTKIRLTLCPEA